MKLLVTEKHDGEGVFPLFKKGTPVSVPKACEKYAHWCSCEIDGHETYIADVYIANGVLDRDYNPTEIMVEKDQIVTLIEIAFEWLYVVDDRGKEGWLPASKAVSIS